MLISYHDSYCKIPILQLINFGLSKRLNFASDNLVLHAFAENKMKSTNITQEGRNREKKITEF